MTKNLILTFLFSVFFCQLHAFSPVQCSPELNSCVQRIQQLPEAREVISKIQKEGPIRILVNREPLAEKFGAFWDPEDRFIGVNLNFNQDEGAIIGSILFELHNALNSKKALHLDEMARLNRIDKAHFIEAMERLEYHNSLATANLADCGIRKGLFPKNARLHTYRNFDEHFYMQRISGHSAWFAALYDDMQKNY